MSIRREARDRHLSNFGEPSRSANPKEVNGETLFTTIFGRVVFVECWEIEAQTVPLTTATAAGLEGSGPKEGPGYMLKSRAPKAMQAMCGRATSLFTLGGDLLVAQKTAGLATKMVTKMFATSIRSSSIVVLV